MHIKRLNTYKHKLNLSWANTVHTKCWKLNKSCLGILYREHNKTEHCNPNEKEEKKRKEEIITKVQNIPPSLNPLLPKCLCPLWCRPGLHSPFFRNFFHSFGKIRNKRRPVLVQYGTQLLFAKYGTIPYFTGRVATLPLPPFLPQRERERKNRYTPAVFKFSAWCVLIAS